MSWTKGWKAFDTVGGRADAGRCRGFLFEEGKTYEIDGKLELCHNGFHACKDYVLCLEYYPQAEIFAEVEFIGQCDYEHPTEHKGATDKIRIVKFYKKEELDLMGLGNSGNYNSGSLNSGRWNSGNYNSGSWNSRNYNSGNGNSGSLNTGNGNTGNENTGNENSGNENSGNYNSGSWNSGSWNSGSYNSGSYNSGSYNSGSWNSGSWNSGSWNSGNGNSGRGNSGNYNSGRWNSGNWNSCNRETGFFNTKEPHTINVFNKPVARDVWESCKKPKFIYFDLDHKLTYKQNWEKAYSTATQEEIELLKALPNFDADVFFELTGICVE